MSPFKPLHIACILAALLAFAPSTLADIGGCATPDFEGLGQDSALPTTTLPTLGLRVAGPADCAATSNTPAPEYDASNGLYTVTTVVHVIMDSTCTQGTISDEDILRQIEILNEDYLALPGTNGSAGADTQIRFELATTDPGGSPTTGITRTCNTTWYNDDGEYWNTLSWDPTRYMNIYVNTAGGAGGYVPVLPASDPQLVGTNVDRVVVNVLGFGPGGPVPAHQLGRLATHEVGHYLGLWHTFKNGCGIATEPDCHTSGDLICDTNPDATASDVCPTGETSCGGIPTPITNHMEYTDDYCKDSFSAEQGMRMRCTLLNYRPGVFSAGTCGNGVIEAGEECDGSDLGGATCSDAGCASGAPSCAGDCTLDYSACSDCGACDFDGTCEAGEDCTGCPSDCPALAIPAATCGNGLCEAGDGEDCLSCPQDCNGVQGGKPANRFCCGFGGENPVGCGDASCTSGGFACTETPQGSGGSACCGDLFCESPEDSTSCSLDCGLPAQCGDGTCDAGEDACSCSLDCGSPPGSEAGLCGDGVDNDCDLALDCADTDCTGDAACQAVDCSQFGDRNSCNAEPSCRWRNRIGSCVAN